MRFWPPEDSSWSSRRPLRGFLGVLTTSYRSSLPLMRIGASLFPTRGAPGAAAFRGALRGEKSTWRTWRTRTSAGVTEGLGGPAGEASSSTVSFLALAYLFLATKPLAAALIFVAASSSMAALDSTGALNNSATGTTFPAAARALPPPRSFLGDTLLGSELKICAVALLLEAASAAPPPSAGVPAVGSSVTRLAAGAATDPGDVSPGEPGLPAGAAASAFALLEAPTSLSSFLLKRCSVCFLSTAWTCVFTASVYTTEGFFLVGQPLATSRMLFCTPMPSSWPSVPGV